MLVIALLPGCASTSTPEDPKPEASVEQPRHHEGKVVGGAGGALAGGAMAYSSAGILCTIGGPLCAIVVVPAAILGGVLGLAAGSVVDAARGAASGGGSPPGDTSARPDESARAEAPPQPY